MSNLPPHPDGKRDLGEAMVLQIVRVADLLVRIGDSKVFGRKLTQAQFNILMILKRYGQDGMSQKDILARLVSTKGNVSIHIANLVRAGYIRRRTSKADGRLNVVTLAAKGRRILADIEPEYLLHLREITDALPRERAESSIELLNLLRAKCEAVLGGSDSPREKR